MHILVIQGSPDNESFSAALASAYADSAQQLGHQVDVIDLSCEPEFDPVLRYGYRKHMEDETVARRMQKQVLEAEHLAFFFPVWWSAEPALLKGWLDRILMPRVAYHYTSVLNVEGLLKGKTASIVTSCHAPACIMRLPGGVVSRWKHWVLGVCGVKLSRAMILGWMDSKRDTPDYRADFMRRVQASVPRR